MNAAHPAQGLEAPGRPDWEDQRVQLLKLQLLDAHPFWGQLLLQVRVELAPELPAFAATDCLRTIWLNPGLTCHLSRSQLGFVLLHELGHHFLASTGRRRGRDGHLWNCATDFAINRIVASIAAPTRPPRPLYDPPSGEIPGLGEVEILLDPRWDGYVAEAIYENLAANELPQARMVEVSLPPSASAARPATRLPGVSDHGGGIDIHLPHDLSPEDLEELEERIGRAVQAWEQSEGRGDLPGSLMRRLMAKPPPRIPWERELSRAIQGLVRRDEWDLRRPDRRYLERGLLVPGISGREPPSIVAAVDTSGSMSDQALARVGAELKSLSDLAPDLTLIVADAVVQEVVPSAQLSRFLARGRLKGGGGTDHRPVFDWVRDRRLAPALFIGLTDLFSRFPDDPPPYPVLWVTPPRHGPAPWGRVIETSTRS